MTEKRNNVYFVSGIDTNVGKSYATGYLAREWNAQGVRTITQKFIQTGNVSMSEDIELHRKIMGCGLLPEDEQKLTMPEIFTFPASPHLAAKIDGRAINFAKIEQATQALSRSYDAVLLEGAGGLMVPLCDDFLTIDYVAQMGYPVVLVSSARLGSVNHTILSLEALKSRGLSLKILAYNLYPEESKKIAEDTKQYLQLYLKKHFPTSEFLEIPIL